MKFGCGIAWCLGMGCWAGMLAQNSSQTTAPATHSKGALSLDFTDDPQFSVAGITDWTAVGGHGADTNLRTSEELARIAARSEAGNATVEQLRAQARAAHEAGHEAQSHRLLGQAAELAGDPLTAVRENAQAAALAPTAENLLQWGSELLLHRAVLQAEAVFADGVRRYPASIALRTGLGSALFAEAKYTAATEELCRAVDLKPDERATELALARIALGSPEPTACALEQMGQWAAAAPADAEALCYAGQVLLHSDADRAEQLLQRAVALDPKLAQAWLQLGVLAAQTHRSVDAERDFRAAIAVQPEGAEAHFRLAGLLRQSGRLDEAKVEFARHEQLKAEDAARVERERAVVKEFVIANGR